MAQQLLPLLIQQPYIEIVSIGKNPPRPVTLDLNAFRSLPMSLRCGLIQGWQQLCTDIWLNPFEPWLTAKSSAQYRSKILISRTTRLQSPYINYRFLSDYQQHLLFVGLPDEHAQFCRSSGLTCPLYTASNFDELATALNSCRLFIGNQGFNASLAEALKIPRILESNPIAPNNFPLSANGRIALFQRQFETFVHTMVASSA
jgi:hypothetical protein